MANVVLKEVCKVYGENVVAVHRANFSVRDGELLVIVGPSGCGKSTLLRMIAGLEEITSGELHIGDRVVNDLPPKERDIAMVFQNYALYPHMSVYDNMAFGLKLRKYSKQKIDERVQEAADILSISGILDRKPEALSGGQRQRVAVGRAIVRKPQAFLFDEPLSNLDAKLRVKMRTELSKLHDRLDATMIYVTHDQTEAMTLGDRIVVMNDGHIQQIDTPLNLYNQPVNTFVGGFIGSPSMNFLKGTISRSGDNLAFQVHVGSQQLRLDGSSTKHLQIPDITPVIMGIRPEDIYLMGSPSLPKKYAEAEFTLSVTEPMGNETVLYTDALPEQEPLIARVSPQELPDHGETISLAFDLEKMHFFDAESGTRLTGG